MGTKERKIQRNRGQEKKKKLVSKIGKPLTVTTGKTQPREGSKEG